MSKTRLALIGALVVSLCSAATTEHGLAKESSGGTCAQLKALDPDNDGTIDLDEAKKAASALFDRLDRNKDGTLDEKELSGRMTKAQFKAANPDNDGTLDKQEFLKVVEMRFKAANSDNDGTIDCRELGNAKGKSLQQVIE